VFINGFNKTDQKLNLFLSLFLAGTRNPEIKKNNQKNSVQMAKTNQADGGKKKSFKAYLPLIIIILFVVTFGVLWYKEYSKYISTDDAYIDSDKVNVSSKIMGRISFLHANEGDLVKEGTLLVELDSTELLAQKAQAISIRNQSLAGKKQAEAKLALDRTNIKIIEINLEKAQEDFDRAQQQFTGGVITKEKMDNVAKALETAKAQWLVGHKLMHQKRLLKALNHRSL
jgi:membrane fusion protein (multidrug efflux system)